MRRTLITFLQAVIVLIGFCTLAFMLWEPHVEGRNTHATLYMIYFNDPFLAYAYMASIPFFVALYQAFMVLGYVKKNKMIVQKIVKSLRIIKYCAIAIIGFVWVGIIFIMFGDSDDRPPLVIIGILITFVSTIIAIATVILERIFQNPPDIKRQVSYLSKK